MDEMRSEPDKAALAAGAPPPPQVKKDRHIVTWTPEEDNLLREQVTTLGTDNWTSIAAQFKDKTSRQCRRRWYTYLNSEGKKGGWSAEEDMILCEAQKIFGNRWTEIAKVVSGRTDNAVKNRFSTLCKKRAKNDALTKDNDGSWFNSRKRARIQIESCMSRRAESSPPTKQIRYQILYHKENPNLNKRLSPQHVKGEVQLRSPPLAVLAHNISSRSSKPAVHQGSNNKTEHSSLKKGDPKLTALLQRAELLSSLALKVNSMNTSESLENAWKIIQELQDHLIQNGERGTASSTFDVDLLLDNFEDLIEGSTSSCAGRQPDTHEESHDSSEYSTGAIQVLQVHANDDGQTDDTISNRSPIVSCREEHELGPSMCTSKVGASSSFSSEERKEIDRNICMVACPEFDSPHQTIPSFKSLAEGIPSPKFSASERRFLLSVFGISSPSPSPSSAQPPSCKRVLLDSL